MTLAPAPARSHQQRHLALAEANRTRTYRATVKRDLKLVEPALSRRRVADIVLNPPSRMLTMKALDLLVATPGIGTVKANRILRKATLSPSKTLGGLTMRQRLSLRAELL